MQSAVYPALILFPVEKKKPVLYEGDVAVIDVMRFVADHGSSKWTIDGPMAYEESLIEDFRLPINHKPTENVDLDNVEQASLDTQLTSSNIGFKLLQKMGWKGKGLVNGWGERKTL
ncbi:hypothetical protein Fmac_022341 [Flemingia macrophylla]|uniref:G-patch domain-containing protein n=1 Tax=Flemingia macrophylla TaxID=520843 RepID=A0ABD1LZG6_9FABA